MAISPKICIQYEADATDILIKDDTGVYSLDNTGGYGTPNNDRADYAAVLRVYYQPFTGDKESLLSLADSIKYNASYTNGEVSQYTVPYKTDGWYKFYYVLVPTSIGAPAEGDIIYDTNVSDLRQYNSSLQLVAVYDEEELFDTNTYELVFVEEARAVKLKGKLSLLAQDFFACKKCSDCDCEEEFMKVLSLRESISSSVVRFSVSKYESQEMIEKLIKQYNV